jgi:arsenite methyltransferase
METVKKISGIVNHPGSFEITDKAIRFCSFKKGAEILDLGCGSGATVDYLTQKYGFKTSGLDIEPETVYIQTDLIKASAEKIPFPENTFDGIIMECSFSMMDDQVKVLSECRRVLRKDGRLIISDMYARGEPARLKGCLGRIDSKDDIMKIIGRNGFTINFFEDFSHHLQTMWGQMIFENGTKSFYCNLGVSPEIMKRVNCGYYLIVAEKNNDL